MPTVCTEHGVWLLLRMCVLPLTAATIAMVGDAAAVIEAAADNRRHGRRTLTLSAQWFLYRLEPSGTGTVPVGRVAVA